KADRAFVRALNEHLNAEGAPAADLVISQWADMAKGAMEETGNPLDVALESDGFFQVLDEQTGDARYTRAGRFIPDAEGLLRTPGGLLVEGNGGPIQLPPNAVSIEIAGDGSIRADGQLIGRLQVVR